MTVRVAEVRNTNMCVQFDSVTKEVIIVRNWHGDSFTMTADEWAELIDQARTLRARAEIEP